ncbi:MAG: glycosyltransferase [Pseudomonadales bacterium]
MKPSSVHQLAINISSSSTQMQALQLIQSQLRSAGLHSEINPDISSELAEEGAQPLQLVHCPDTDLATLSQLADNPLTVPSVLVLHHSTGCDQPAKELLGKLRSQFSYALAGTLNAQQCLLASGFSEQECQLLALPQTLPNTVPKTAQHSFQDPQLNYQLLFVGDLTPNNHPLAALEALATLRTLNQAHICLQWIGEADSPQYLAQVQQHIADLNLSSAISLIDQASEALLDSAFQCADLYLCLAAKANAGLLRAAQMRLPVLALTTLFSPELDDAVYPNIGLRLTSPEPQVCAATLEQLMRNPRLRTELCETAISYCDHYSARHYCEQLQQVSVFADRLPAAMPQPAAAKGLRFRLEGPFDSSYSLALVNRELSRAFNKLLPGEIGLYSTEGGGDFAPNPQFLADNPDIAAMAEQGQLTQPVDVALRLLYPPRVSAMQGKYNGLGSFGWEESYLPAEYIDNFNQHLHFATTVSRYVSRTLVDNGVTCPVFAIGNGADHILQVAPDHDLLPALPQDTLRLLHISSCFPRKGVAPMLEAYGRAFSSTDKVCLIIKTFANPHHNIEQEIKDWAAALTQPPQVILINKDLPDSAIRALYQAGDVLIAPSKGEGFGLPMAEAMLHDLPVITTGYSGQLDFCTEQNSWLIDYQFARAQSHISEGTSVWVEPCPQHLSELMSAFYQAYSAGELAAFSAAKVAAGRELIQREYSWQAVAKRSIAAMQQLPELPLLTPEPKFAMITTWNSKCGIATYSKLLTQPAMADALILANYETELIEEDQPNVIRCWQSGVSNESQNDDLSNLLQVIENQGIEQVLIQFNFSFFDLPPLQNLLQVLAQKGVQVLLTLHSTADVYWGEKLKTLRDLQPQINQISRVFVHSVADLNQLKDFDIIDNVTLFPHGVQQLVPGEQRLLEPALSYAAKLQGKTVLASYGFLLPHKGIEALIHAFIQFRQSQPNSHLLLVNAEYPAAVSAECAANCRALIAKHHLAEDVTLISDFLSNEQSQSWLSLADCIIYPYQQTQESSSAAVRWGLALEKPVFCTPLNIFEDVASAVHLLPGTSSSEIATGLLSALADPQLLAAKQNAQQNWLNTHCWQRLSQRLQRLLSALAIEKCLQQNSLQKID